MTLSIRGRLIAASLLLLATIGLTSGVWLEQRLRATLDTRIEGEVQRLTAVVAARVSASDSRREVASLDPIADEMGDAMTARVTVIDHDGRLLGDSRLPSAVVERTESHADRPEVVAALADGTGTSRRRSTTVDTDLLYVTQRVQFADAPPLVVRVAVPLSEVGQAVHTLRVRLLLAAVMGLAVAVLLSILASGWYAKTLSDLAERSRNLASRRLVEHEAPQSGDEIGRISTSIDQIGDDIEGLVQTLVNERDRFLAVLEGMQAAVIALDADRTISVVNSAARLMLDIRDNPVGKSLVEVIRIPALVELAGADIPKQGMEKEIEIVGPPSRVFQARATSARVTGGVVLVLNDITEIQRLETVRRDFVANVSHELRTPVSVIQANAETLLDGALDDEAVAREFTGAILRSSERLSNLVADLLDLARIESGSFQMDQELVHIHACVDRAFETVARKAKRRSVTLVNDVSPEFVLGADVTAMEQVLVNLIENAVKYGQEGGHVWVRDVRHGDSVSITVEDDGPGISPQHRERLFERFYRVDTGRSRAEGGTGLGLSIVKHLVNAMGFEISMEAREPHGCCFRIETAIERVTVAS